MDKNNKNRTDLLAAGRKKLQQFRQKKDGKGGKASVNPRKHGRDGGANAATTETSEKFPDKEVSVPDTGDLVTSLELRIAKDSSVAGNDGPIVDQSQEDGITESITVLINKQLGVEDSRRGSKRDHDVKFSVPLEAGGGIDIHEDVELGDSGSSENVTSEEKFTTPDVRVPVDLSSLGERGREEQEGSSSGSKQIDGSSGEIRIDRLVSDYCNMVDVEEVTSEAVRKDQSDDVSSTAMTGDVEEAPKRGLYTVPSEPLSESELLSIAIAELQVAEINNAYYSSSEGAQADKSDQKDAMEGSLAAENAGLGRSLGRNITKLPLGPNPCSISFSQLSEIIKELDEDEFRFLCSLRESSIENLKTTCLDAEVNYFENLKEQLYLTSFTKDANEMQLCEQLELEMQFRGQIQKLVDEISVTNASLSDVQGRNEILSRELADCKSEIQDFSSGREELQKQLLGSKAELEEFSAKVDDLQNKLERSGGELARLASELTDSRNSFAPLQVENESLNDRLSLLTEEKMAIAEDKDYLLQENEKMAADLAHYKALSTSVQSENVKLTEYLASVKEGNKKLVEANECLVHENCKLVADLADCNVMVEALRIKITELIGLLAAVEEEKKNLEEEQAKLVHDNEKLALDLVDTRSSTDAIQAEMSNLNGSMASLMEVKNKLEDEKQYLLSKNETGLRELADCKVVIADLQADFGKAMSDLKAASLHIEQLIQENVLLGTSLELHIAEMSSFEDAIVLSEDSGRMSIVNVDSSSLTPSTEVSENAISEILKISSKGTTDGPLPGQLVLDDSNDQSGFECWKVNLKEASEILQKLEDAVDAMQSLSASLSRSSGKQVAPGVSKLIHAFETKHIDDNQLAEMQLAENPLSVDPYMQAKEQSKKLQMVFKQLLLQVESTCLYFEEERKNRLSKEVLNVELKASCVFWESHVNNLEKENIELVCLCEVLKQHSWNSEESVKELLVSYKDLEKHEVDLDTENSQLKAKLRNFQDKVIEFQSHLDEIYRTSEQMLYTLYSKVETFHEGISDLGLVLESDWKTFVTWIVEEFGKLDMSIGTMFSIALSTERENIGHVGSVVATSFDVATKLIRGLLRQLLVTKGDHLSVLSNYTELNKQFNYLQTNNASLIDIWDNIYRKLRRVVESGSNVLGTGLVLENEKSVDPLDPGVIYDLLDKLQNSLDEKLQLLSDNERLRSDRIDQVREIDELKRRCFHLDAILKLIENAGEEFILDTSNINPFDPLSRLESFINILIQKYKETTEQVRLSKKNPVVNEMKFDDFHGQLDHLILLLVHCESENIVLKESWRAAIRDIPALQAGLLEKVAELEQSEHHVSSLREKLGIAVSKGKGLIVQRDSLKQSLAEISSQLEKCSQESQFKDVRIFELEAKLKTYSEAGERMEALKSELAYIRNSASALRESFLLKDSVLQRIEEILEDLELPEHFHSRDIIEKVDWLAQSITRNTSLVDWDQKSSVGGSYPESEFTAIDGWREEAQPNQDSADNFRRRYEELQGKFYGLAEHNEMLEQSLMERNNLLKYWEEILGKIEIPSQLSILDPEDKIQWLGGALSDFQSQCHSLQQRIDYLDTLCGSLTADLELSRIRILELESAYHSVISEKDFLLKNLQTVTNDYDEFSKKTSLLETENENKLKEISSLQKQLDQKLVNEEHVHYVEAEVRRFQGLIRDVLRESVTDAPEFASDNLERLEHLLKKLIEEYRTLLTHSHVNFGATDLLLNENDGLSQHEEKIRDSGDSEDVVALRKRLEDTLGEIMSLKEERDRYSKNESLVLEIEALHAKNSELQELLNHEEQKSASLREKLNIAVKRGKSLVQQRDNLKQVIDEANTELDRLKSVITLRENSIVDYENKVANLSISLEKIKVIDSDCTLLRECLSDARGCLEEKEHMLNRMVEYFKDFEVDFDLGSGNPFEKLEAFGKFFKDLRAALDFSDQESRKSKRAAELLVAELNEVQERNDTLQDDLVKVATELSELSKQNKLCEAEKFEALANLEKLSAVRLEERDRLFSEVSMLRSGIDQLQIDISAIDSSLADVLSKDLEILRSLDVSIKICLEPENITNMPTMPAAGAFSGLNFPKLESQIFMTEVGSLKERLQRHYHLLHEEAKHIFETVRTVYTKAVSLKESFGAKDKELVQLKSAMHEKDSELFVMRKNVSLLHEACNISIAEIENWKTQQSDIGSPGEAPYISLKSQTIVGKNASTIETHPYLEENIMSLREKLLLTVKDLIAMQNAILEGSQKEMRTLIFNLQKELHEKDNQRDRICSELISQIKEAEAMAMSHLQDLQSSKTQANDLQGRLSVMEEERGILEIKIKELEDREAMSIELTQRVTSLTDALAAKDQEIEALMHALDEEEFQMEGLSNKILELEKVLLQKNQELENLESSRGKALKKLSVTVGKFDELHSLSETLLSEVENLQSQLQERDEEISFLRKEVTRCTNEVLSVTQMSNKRHIDEVLKVLSFLDTMVSQVQVPDMSSSDAETNEIRDYEVKVQKKISFILSELEKLQTMVQDRDLLFVAERSRVEELMQKEQILENSLLEKESQLSMLRRLADSGQATSPSSEIVEVDPLINKRAPGNITPQVRGGRKMNSDHVAIAIDMDPTSSIEDDDDDKAHGFKSLTTSAIVPRFTRPVSDMIDGLWMSCDRALMRQPSLRLGVIIYWAIIHTLLAAFVV